MPLLILLAEHPTTKTSPLKSWAIYWSMNLYRLGKLRKTRVTKVSQGRQYDAGIEVALTPLPLPPFYFS